MKVYKAFLADRAQKNFTQPILNMSVFVALSINVPGSYLNRQTIFLHIHSDLDFAERACWYVHQPPRSLICTSHGDD